MSIVKILVDKKLTQRITNFLYGNKET